MAASEAVGTDELLRNILLELQALNRNLEKEALTDSAQRARRTIPEFDSRVSTSPERVNSHQSHNASAISYIDSSQGGQSPDIANPENVEPILWMKSVLPFEEEKGKDIPGLLTSSYSAYHWRLRADDWMNKINSIAPFPAESEKWSEILPQWGIPPDGHLALSFETEVLLETCLASATGSEQAIKNLKAVRDITTMLRNSSVGDCGVNILDRLDNEIGNLIFCSFSFPPFKHRKWDIFYKPRITLGSTTPKNAWDRFK